MRHGVLVQNNIPVYSVRGDTIWVLDAQGKETGAQLKANNSPLLESFESPEFQLNHVAGSHAVIKLPRYTLNFELKAGILINQETNEQVLERPSPIHPAVAGLVMDNKGQQRYLVPIARFYGTEKGAQHSDFYPVVHDIEGTIAHTTLKHHWSQNPPLQKPMWHYPNTEYYASFQLKDGEPIANTVADALYLTYMYLATNQTKKAWKTLEECTTRLGGITGSPDELKYITWICKEMPHVLPGQKNADDYKKDTPPYVACQLKAMSLLCNHIFQNGPISINTTKPSADTANTEYESLCTQDLERFQASLPDTIYQSFSRLQQMRRHQDHTYRLSPLERKHLLSYYHHSQPKDHAPKGALGFEWLSLSLETLQEERAALLSRKVADHSLSSGDQKRLDKIQANLAQLTPVVAHSTALEQVSINLDLSYNSTINTLKLSQFTTTLMGEWQHILPGKNVSSSEKYEALDVLFSTVSDDVFISHFPAYLQMTQSGTKQQCAALFDFCSKTLLAKRHIPLEQQESNIPLLCNILYRILASDNTTLFRYSTFNFSALVSRLSDLKVPPLHVYQAKDVYHNILATPDQIMAQQERPRHAPLIAAKSMFHSLIVQTGIDTILDETAHTSKIQLDEIISEYKINTNKSDEALTLLGKKLNNALDHTFVIEEQAGVILLNLEQQKNALADALMTQPGLTKALLTAASSAEPQIKAQREQSWSKALELANKGPEDLNRARAWAIEKKSKARPALTQSDLMSLYSRADFAYSVEKTGLSLSDVQRVHDVTHQALIHGIQLQALEKIQTDLYKASASGNANIAAQALDVLSRTEIPGLDEPSLVILQHEEQILLRKRQVSALKSLLMEPEDGHRFNETIEKIIMGGGKSKVILPILAEKKAQGDNLVVVEVPQALLATNHVDLNQTSQRLFGKRAYRFEFNRDSDSSPKRLETLYHQFIEIMTTRGYLVTTGESVQSLELKYLELLMASGKKEDTWEQQIYWCDKITNLFRHHTDCIIDEVHQGLSTKKKLNYTSGKPKPIGQSLIKNATALFSFIDMNLIKEAPSFNEHYDWTSFKTNLATKLITEPASPLTSFVNQSNAKYGATIQGELIAYLLNQVPTIPQAVLMADAEIKAAFGFFKQEINVRLPQTLTEVLYKKYGPSKRNDLSPVEQTVAIPYAGTHVPNERNRYQDELEAINKTCQMMLLEGISKELLVERIVEWETLAREELLKMPAATPKPTIDNTPTAQGFALLTSGLGLKLSDIDSKNSDQMTQVHQHLRFNRPFIFDCLRESSLKQIQQDSAIISSDNFNHADQYRSVQGVSGTPPWNDAAYHQRLSYDKTSSLGTDGYVFELMRSKKSSVSSCDYKHVAQFISTILSSSSARERTRAIIDIKGTFTDVNNLEVAKHIAGFIKAHPNHFNHSIKQVLYFNEDQVLCALDVTNPAKTTVLGTSETNVLNRMLNSTPEERFTLYDQIHTVGTDIKQYNKAHAVVLVDDKTSMQNFLQGCMRQRELELNQTNELIVPQRMHGISLDALGDQFKNNDKQAVFAEAPAAACGQMRNHIRRHFLTLIQDIPSEDVKKKAVLTQHFRPLFEDTPSLNLFALYGGINKKQAIEGILNHYKEQMATLWETRLNAADLAPHAQDIEHIAKEMQRIIKRAIPFCLPEYEGLDSSFSAEIEVQKEVQKEVQIETLTLNETYNSQRMEQPLKSWPNSLDTNNYFKYHTDIRTYSSRLNYIFPKDSEGLNLFSNNLYTSINYTHTYREQDNSVDAFLKPVFLIWYHIHEGQLSAMIVTPQEAQELAGCIKRDKNNWLSTTQDTIIAGERPKGILDYPNYQELREQVRFFNGEFSSLLDQEAPIQWLQKQPEEKINFYKRTLLPYKPGSANKLLQFEAYLTQTKFEGFAYISEHPFEDLTQFDWKTLYPEILAKQKEDYVKFAEAFIYLNQNWDKRDLTAEDLQQQFRLPVNSLMYINNHLDHLITLKKILNDFEKIRGSRTFLEFFVDDLKHIEKECVEQCIGMTINQFYDQCHCKPIDTLYPFSDSEAISISTHSISLLNILNVYQALKDRNQLNNCFEDIALKATSLEELHALLNTERLSQKLISNIINNSSYNDSLMGRILNAHQPLSEDNLCALANKCQNIEYIDQLLRQSNINNKVLNKLLSIRFLSESQLIAIIKRANDPITFDIGSEHPSLSSQVITEMLQHSLLPKSALKRLLEKNPFTEKQLSRVLQCKHAVHPGIITRVLEQNKIGDTILREILEHHNKSDIAFSTIYKHPDASPETRQGVLKHPLLTASSALDIINDVVPTDDDLLLILNNQNACNNAFRIAVLRQCKLNADHFNALVDNCQSSEILQMIFSNQSENAALREKILKHPRLSTTDLLKDTTLSDNEILLLMQHPTITNELLEVISRKPSIGNDVLLALIRHEKAAGHTLFSTVNHSLFDLNAASFILKRADITDYLLFQLAHKTFELNDNSLQWEECIRQIITKAKVQNVVIDIREILQEHLPSLSTKSALQFLESMGNDYLANVALNLLIQKATKEDLDKLISPNVHFNHTELSEFETKNLNTQQIDNLLDHPSMNSTVANNLFEKPTYSGEIKDWNWLSKDQLIDTLNRTRDFGSLKIAFDRLSKSKLKKWYDQKSAEHHEDIKLGLASTKVEDKLLCALEELKLKSLSHCINAIDNPKYEQAAQSSFELYQKLRAEAEQFLKDPNAHAAIFRKNCEEAINNAKPVLGQHRGFKQILLDIINVIFAISALFRNGNWRLFEANTASMNTVNKVLKNMDELIENNNQNIIPPVG